MCDKDCNQCDKPYQIKGQWCYDARYDVPKLINGPQKFGEYYVKPFWTFDYCEGEKI